jgi:hypothetical protein
MKSVESSMSPMTAITPSWYFPPTLMEMSRRFG